MKRKIIKENNLNSNYEPDKILIMGVGNLIMGDEGVGIHVIKELEKSPMPDNVDLLDGGTGGFHLLSYLQNYPLVIMIDATLDQNPEGTVKTIKPKFASDFPKALSAHDIGLKDLLEAVTLLDKLPEMYLITISIKDLSRMSVELSSIISETIPAVIKELRSILAYLSHQEKEN